MDILCSTYQPLGRVVNDPFWSDSDRGSQGTGCCFLSRELFRGGRQPDRHVTSEPCTRLGTESWSGSSVSEEARAGVLASLPAARGGEMVLSKGFGFIR